MASVTSSLVRIGDRIINLDNVTTILFEDKTVDFHFVGGGSIKVGGDVEQFEGITYFLNRFSTDITHKPKGGTAKITGT